MIFLVVAPLFQASAKNEKVKFGVSPSYDIPFLFIDKETGDMRGLSIDLIQQIAKKMNVTAEVISLPRNRVEAALADGSIDIICYSNPAWTKHPELFKWSDPILELSDHLVRYHKAAPIKSLSELKGQSVGTVANYFYEKITPLVESKLVERSDFFDGQGLFKRLQMGQIHYGILNSYFLQYHGVLPIAQENDSVVDTGLIDSKYKIYCRSWKKNKLDMRRINKAIETVQLKIPIKK
ncbi:MAG: transporter substrate-binding domain-containing protein [Bdellovibrio sp.]|nr:transporter substrate-binding domain-containing protein [Bdellovibrio sp.]